MPKTVLITGAAKRIGKSLAQFFHTNNYNVIIHYNSSKSEAKELCDNLNQRREKSACVLGCDLNNLSAIDNFAKEAVLAFNGLDLLINNASVYYQTQLDKLNFEQANEIINTNVTANIFLIKYLSSHLANSKGSIINITDSVTYRRKNNYLIYNTSKSALNSLTKNLALELAPKIRVNAIAPGAILMPSDNVETKEEILRHIPLQNFGNPDDIAKAALFLAENNYITGQILAIDGGRGLAV